MVPLLGLGLAAGAATSVLQGFLGFSAQRKQNQAAQQALANLSMQEDFYNTSFQQRLGLLRESQMFNMEGLLASIPQARRSQRQEYEQASGMARAAVAESGSTLTGSKAALMRSIDIQGALNRRTLEDNIRRSLVQDNLNYRSALFGAGQSYSAQQFQIMNTRGGLQSQQNSEGLALASGALGGFGTGLSIVGGLYGLTRP